MDFLPKLEPVENLAPPKPKEPALELEIKNLNEPPLEEPEPEEQSPFKKIPKKIKKERGQPKKKPKKKPIEEVQMIYEEEEEEEEPVDRQDEIVIDPKREKRLENLRKAREARKAKSDYKKKTPKIKPALSPEPTIRETFNKHLLPTEEEKKHDIMEKEHLQFMKFMNNMEKYKTLKSGFQTAEIIDRKNRTPPVAPVEKSKPKIIPRIIKPIIEEDPYAKYFS